jgi:hypothetical protein
MQATCRFRTSDDDTVKWGAAEANPATLRYLETLSLELIVTATGHKTLIGRTHNALESIPDQG